MHDLLHLAITHLTLAATSSTGPEVTTTSTGSSDSTVKVAIVTAIGLVVATAITAIASTFRRPPSPTGTVGQTETFTRQYISGLERDRRDLAKLRITYSYLREACLKRGMDPDDLIEEIREQASS